MKPPRLVVSGAQFHVEALIQQTLLRVNEGRLYMLDYIPGLAFASKARYSMKKGSGVSLSEIQSGEQGKGHSS